MPLSTSDALTLAADLRQISQSNREPLDLIQDYLRDDPDKRTLSGLPAGTPQDVVRLSRLARVNLLKYVVNSRVQNMYVDGFRTPTSPDDLDVWKVWQRNRMDARQIGVHRAALSFGRSYAVVLPATSGPRIRGASPRDLTVGMPADDPDADWPAAAWWHRGDKRWWLIDDEAVYRIADSDGGLVLVGEPEEHGATYQGRPVCPVTKFRETDDLDDPERGIVQPLISLQDQINVTTFGLLVAQHYGAFRQLVILGWIAENAEEALKRGAARLLMFEDAPGDVSVEALPQTELRGYIESREASIRHLATISQTPVHELLGQIVNLSAEALEAIRASHQAAIDENRIMAGESWEQVLSLAGEMAGVAPDDSASVLWRDTRVRSLAEAALALGTLVEKLGVPPRELWSRIPGVPQHELERWQAAADQGDPFADLTALLDRQAGARGGGG